MEMFKWGPQFVTGQAEVDAQHQTLVGLINEFGEALSPGGGFSASDLSRICGRLKQYTVEHFTEEEALMLREGLPAGYREKHHAQHQVFIGKIDQLEAAVGKGATSEVQDVFAFLVSWLAVHIQGADVEMGRTVSAARTP